jgi:hypothetical protein
MGAMLRVRVGVLCVFGLVGFGLVGGAGSAFASGGWWLLSVGSRPSVLGLAPGGEGEVVVTAENVGDGSVVGGVVPVTVGVVLPAHLRALGIVGSQPAGAAGNVVEPIECSLARLSCTLRPSVQNASGSLPPFGALEVRVQVQIEEGTASGAVVHAAVSGGDAPAAGLSRALLFSEGGVGFGIEDTRLSIEGEGGGLDTLAGSHPFQVTGSDVFNQGQDLALSAEKPEVEVAVLPKDVITRLPAGFVGNPTAIARCTLGQFLTNVDGIENRCPADSAVGVASATVREPENVGTATFTVPVFNLEPYAGEPARFGFFIPAALVPVVLDTQLRSGPGEDYGVNVIASNVSQTASLLSASVTFWGVPGDSVHDASRGWKCLEESAERLALHAPCNGSEEAHPPAFLSLPTSCTGALQTSVEVDSWDDPGAFEAFTPSEPLQALDGCAGLGFHPAIEAATTSRSISSPTGLSFDLAFSDEGLTDATGVAESQLKRTVVTLPEGLTINPSAGVGLAGCTVGDLAHETLGSPGGAGCPEASKLGSVEAQTPLLSAPVHGWVFAAEPYENPFSETGHAGGSLLAVYVVVKSPEAGVLVKLAGKVEAGGQPGVTGLAPGQLRTSLESPQLPFAHFVLHLFEGNQAPLISPATCGSYSAQASLTPWSEPMTTLTEDSSFAVTTGINGSTCPTGGGTFAPQLQAGTASNSAGSFSSFDLDLTRGDRDQEISSLSTTLPEGLTGELTGIPYCPEADIALARTMTGEQEQAMPSCPAASEVGHSLVGAGDGSVLAYTPGKIYLAGPYDNDPFSLVSITSAVVGPFDLGTVVIRLGLHIDPRTAQVTVQPTPSEPIPYMIDGIVAHIRDIQVYIDRPNFTLNPTNCVPLTITSTITSSQGTTADPSSRFQAADCSHLKFTPKVSVSVTGHNSKLYGAGLKFRIAYPPNPVGSQAWFDEVKVEFPKKLPARLETLQRSCLSTVFDKNPADCPPAAAIGRVVVHTPILPVPLTGPAYFVSYGGAKFPEAVFVLQGDGVTVDLHGETYISKQDITSATFRNTPAVPFESIEVTLPQDRYSEFGANVPPRDDYSLCNQKLMVPTLLKAQNGLQKNQIVPITITSCAKHKKRSRSRKHAK